jgi:hypothetical protein
MELCTSNHANISPHDQQKTIINQRITRACGDHIKSRLIIQ